MKRDAEQLTLLDVGPSNRSRPTKVTVLLEAAKECIRKHLPDLLDNDFENHAKDIVDAYDEHSSAYSMCRQLDNIGWYIDDETYQAIDSVGIISQKLLDKELELWAKDVRLQHVSKNKGDVVTFKYKFNDTKTGTVVYEFTNCFQTLVCIDGKQNIRVNWEDISE